MTSISLITPCYNGADFLRSTLECALQQTLQPHEIIVIDDGSTDESASIAESFGGEITLLRQENQGESVARNVGIQHATGTHVLFLDADDLLHPYALQVLSAAAAQSNDPATVFQMRHRTFRKDSEITEAQKSTPNIASEVSDMHEVDFVKTAISESIGCPNTTLFPRQLVAQLGGFQEGVKYSEDWHLWMDAAISGAKLKRLNYEGSFYRIHENSQVRRAKQRDVRLGHLLVRQRLLEHLLRHPELCETHGEQAFWAAWISLKNARTAGLTWSDCEEFTKTLDHFIKTNEASVDYANVCKLAKKLSSKTAFKIASLADLFAFNK